MAFSQDSIDKIQSVIDLFSTDRFRFDINGKQLETLIIGGGMAMDISTEGLAYAFGRTGSAGTIALSKSRYLDDYKRLDFRESDMIIGVNNLVSLSDYEANYEIGMDMGADFIASGAKSSPAVVRRTIMQIQHLGGPKHYWTIPLISSVDQIPKHVEFTRSNGELKKRHSGMIIIENEQAGGHNGPGLDLEGTIDAFLRAGIDLMGNKLIFAGDIRTPVDAVKVLDAGFHAIQLGSIALLATEANITDYYRRLLIYSKPGDVGNIPSPAGLPGKGFLNAGIMRKVLAGKSLDKRPCEYNKFGCLTNCNKIDISAEQAGVKNYGDYCIMDALYALHQELGDCKYGPEDALYFCGSRPEEIFITPYMREKGVDSLPLNFILGKFIEGMYDSVMAGDGLLEHRGFLEQRYKKYKEEKPEEYSSKLVKDLKKVA